MAAPIAQGIKSEGGIIVSFDGSTGKGNCGISGTAIFCDGDFEIMDQYVACAVKNRNVDPKRIYTAGCSAGGLTATAMAAMRAQYIAASVPNSGGSSFPSAFSSPHIPPIMLIHGAMGTDVVGLDFAQSSASAAATWRQKGGLALDCDTGGSHCGGSVYAGDGWTFMKAHPFGVSPEPYKDGLPSGWTAKCTFK
jgi:hypothetical protein